MSKVVYYNSLYGDIFFSLHTVYNTQLTVYYTQPVEYNTPNVMSSLCSAVVSVVVFESLGRQFDPCMVTSFFHYTLCIIHNSLCITRNQLCIVHNSLCITRNQLSIIL